MIGRQPFENLVGDRPAIRRKGDPEVEDGQFADPSDILFVKRFIQVVHRPEALLRTPLTPTIFLNALNRLYTETGLPIHLTEVSAKMPDATQRAEALDLLFRLGFSHQAVQAIILWGFGEKTHWMGADAALVNADGSLNAAGQRISHLLREEWTTSGTAATGVDGRLAFHGFFGSYTLKITLPDGRQVEQNIELSKSAPKGVVTLTE